MLAPPFRPCRMLMRPHYRAIHVMHFPVQAPSAIRLLLDGGEEPLPDPGLPPALAAAGDGLPRPIPRREIAPGSARPQDPEHPVDNPPMIVRGAPGPRALGWQQRGQPCPLLVGQITSVRTVILATIPLQLAFANTP